VRDASAERPPRPRVAGRAHTETPRHLFVVEVIPGLLLRRATLLVVSVWPASNAQPFY